jgi:hypothetical protein
VRRLVAFLWFSLALVLPCEPSFCADVGPLAISVPEGFDGPARSDEAGGVTYAWVKHRPVSDGGTLLQVSAIDLGTSLDAITPPQRAEAANHYLLEFAKGIGQSLGDFKFGDIEHVTLAGLPAARGRWTGIAGGSPAVGVLYCVVVGHSVVSLHTQDIGSEITPAMYSAMGAIERVRAR